MSFHALSQIAVYVCISCHQCSHTHSNTIMIFDIHLQVAVDIPFVSMSLLRVDTIYVQNIYLSWPLFNVCFVNRETAWTL